MLEVIVRNRLWGTVLFTVCGVFIAWILYEFGFKEVAYLVVLILPLGALLYVYNSSKEGYEES